jgi:hypothetical protein
MQTKALARLHSGGSLNRSHACTAEGGGSFIALSGRLLSTEEQRAQIRQGMQAFEQATTPRKRVLHPDYLKRKRGLLAFLANIKATGEISR